MQNLPRSVVSMDSVDRLLHAFAGLGVLGALSSGPIMAFPFLFADYPTFYNLAGTVHSWSGAISFCALVLHLARVTMGWLEGRDLWVLMFKKEDFTQLLQGLMWGLGKKQPPPRLRYDYRQRIPYTLFIFMAFPIFISGWLLGNPGKGVGLISPGAVWGFGLLHEGLGLLAMLVLVWHLFFGLLEPGVFLSDWSFITGKISWRVVKRSRPGWAEQIRIDAGEAVQEEQDPSAESVEELLERGNEAVREGDFARAIASYREALEIFPGFAQAWFNLGAIHLKTGETEKGVEALERYLEVDPFGPVAGRAKSLIRDLGSKR